MATSQSSPTPFIRPYNPNSDEPSISHICSATAHESILHEPSKSIAPYIWAIPYTRLCPNACLVLDSGSGTPVGYILGTPSTAQFVNSYHNTYIPSLDTKLLPRPGMEAPAAWAGKEFPTGLLNTLYSPDSLLQPEIPGMVEQFPAHLHIDILPTHQGGGHGRMLMDSFLEYLTQEGVKGVHLGMAGDNIAAERFYKRCGWERHNEILDEGLSGEVGRDKNRTIWMVKKLL